MNCAETSMQRDRSGSAGAGSEGGLLMVAVVMLGWAGGCASPPAVDGLLAQVGEVMAAEREAIAVDASRSADAVDAQRESLAAGFEADIEQQDEIEREWVVRGVRVYAEAREALARHEAELEAEYEARQHNLALAEEALERARVLLGQQDRLFERVPDVRAYLGREHERYQSETEAR